MRNAAWRLQCGAAAPNSDVTCRHTHIYSRMDGEMAEGRCTAGGTAVCRCARDSRRCGRGVRTARASLRFQGAVAASAVSRVRVRVSDAAFQRMVVWNGRHGAGGRLCRARHVVAHTQTHNFKSACALWCGFRWKGHQPPFTACTRPVTAATQSHTQLTHTSTGAARADSRLTAPRRDVQAQIRSGRHANTPTPDGCRLP